MKEEESEIQSGTVPTVARRPDQPHGQWSWVCRTVWTDRMLKALEEGVKGGRWYSLMDKVADQRTLTVAFYDVARNKGAAGVDHQTIEMFAHDLTGECFKLAAELRTKQYHPKPVRRAWIPKPGSLEKRPLGIPAVRDRVVQTALRHVLEPIFEKEFAEQSYGFRPNRGCKDALRQVDALLREGHVYVVDADLKSYFDTIPHKALLKRVEERVADGEVLKLIEAFLKAKVMDELTSFEPEEGSPQGAVISPLLSNIYLDPLDREMERAGYRMVRYADDFVVLCRSAEEAQAALERVRRWTEEAGLKLHPDKTRIVDARQESFEFLGYRFDRGRKWPRRKSLKKLRDNVREKTKRTDGNSLETIIKRLNRTLRGWFEYFKHCGKNTFPEIDAFVRGRLRAILRKRHGLRGRGRGKDHNRWPNAFFQKHELLSLSATHAQLRQSLAR